jgi:hypothetical protein
MMKFTSSAWIAAAAVHAAATLFGSVAVAAAAEDDEPNLQGESFKITIIEADGFVTPDPTAENGYSGYIIDMIQAVSERAGFEYELLLPSGYGDHCSTVPSADDTNSTNSTTEMMTPYDELYASAYLCGQDDTLDPNVPEEYSTDMYWSMYYVTNSRQLEGKFSLPFKPPASGLTMYGTATGIDTFNDLMSQQKEGSQGPACVGANTAYAKWLKGAMPNLQTVDIVNTETSTRQALEDGTCTVVINAEHAAYYFVKNSYSKEQCMVDDKPVGVIGEGLSYGLTQMAAGFNKGMDSYKIDTISYWLNKLMTCTPNADACDDSLYISWITNAGSGNECGYDDQDDASGNSADGSTTSDDKSSSGSGFRSHVNAETILHFGVALVKAAAIASLV